jgi:hypothetical protein
LIIHVLDRRVYAQEFVTVRDVVERQRQAEQKRAEAAAHAQAAAHAHAEGDGGLPPMDRAQRRRSTANLHSHAQLARPQRLTVDTQHEDGLGSGMPSSATSYASTPKEGSSRVTTPAPTPVVAPAAEGGAHSPYGPDSTGAGEGVSPTKRKLLQRRKSSIM